MATIEVRVAGRGRVVDGDAIEDASVEAKCALCGQGDDVVVSVGPSGGGPYACKTCMRKRLEAVTLGIYLLDKRVGLPWGKFSG